MQAGLGMQRQLMTVTHATELEGPGVHRMVLAAKQEPRGKDYEINLEGVSFENYMKNPVVLWAHAHGVNLFSSGTPAGGIPVAKTLEIGHDDEGRIVTDFQFNSNDPFASRIENAWKGGVIHAASIGFLPTKVSELEDAPQGSRSFRIDEADLVEWSFVPIPADPDAVREVAHALNLPEELFRVEPTPPQSASLPEVALEQDAGPDGLIRELVALASPLFHRLEARVHALERRVWAQDAEKDIGEAQPSLEPSDGPDPALATLATHFAAMRQIIEEK